MKLIWLHFIGKCTDPSVIFGAGLDGRKATEFSFLPHDQTQFAHGVRFL